MMCSAIAVYLVLWYAVVCCGMLWDSSDAVYRYMDDCMVLWYDVVSDDV